MSKVKEQPNCEGCEFFKHTNKFHHCWRYTQETSLCKLRQEPIEQPPDSDFTKKMREEHKEVYLHRPCQYTTDIYDLCDIIDRSEASRKDLLTALKRISDIEDKRYTHCGFDLEVNNISKAAIAKEKEVKI